MVEFEAELLSTGKTSTGFIVPNEIVEKLGGGRKPKVAARLGDYVMRSSVAFMGGQFWLGISAAHRDGSGLKAGDRVTVRLELDTEPREVGGAVCGAVLQPQAPTRTGHPRGQDRRDTAAADREGDRRTAGALTGGPGKSRDDEEAQAPDFCAASWASTFLCCS